MLASSKGNVFKEDQHFLYHSIELVLLIFRFGLLHSVTGIRFSISCTKFKLYKLKSVKGINVLMPTTNNINKKTQYPQGKIYIV